MVALVLAFVVFVGLVLAAMVSIALMHLEQRQIRHRLKLQELARSRVRHKVDPLAKEIAWLHKQGANAKRTEARRAKAEQLASLRSPDSLSREE